MANAMPRPDPNLSDATRARLVLKLLGPPMVLLEGHEAVAASNQKAVALLAYLAVEADRSHARESLATLFWPEQDQKRALQNLRQLLSRLKRSIGDSGGGPPFIEADAHLVRFRAGPRCWVDVTICSGIVEACETHGHRRLEACTGCVSRLEEACAIYRGPFLDGLHVSGASHELDEWLLVTRERFNLAASAAMHAVAGAYLAWGRPDEARPTIARQLDLDPWNEAAERNMMRALALTDGRNAALRHYRGFKEALQRDLGVDPEDDTVELEGQIRSGALLTEQLSDPTAHIPVAAAPLIGRCEEVHRIEALLAGRDQRLVTLHGPGGMGKTRVAMAVAERQAPLWRDGVWFVPLAAVQEAEDFPGALADTLGMPTKLGQLDGATIGAHLHEREALVVLDSFEHLVDATPVIGEILQTAPNVKVLVTSRARLGLREEWVVALGRLDVPDDAFEVTSESFVEQADAVRMFAQCARRGVPGFEIGPENIAAVVRICRAVDGLPLGLELAAAWRRMLPCDQIAEEIESGLGFLEDPAAGVPERQASLRSAFESSYRLLSDDVQAAFRKLSVFRGGFMPPAAEHVAGADPSLLVALVDNSLLTTHRSGRLDSHPAVREFASERLRGHPDEDARTQDAHRAYYMDYVAQVRQAECDGDKVNIAALLAPEIENVRLAWDRAVACSCTGQIAGALQGLSDYFFAHGRFEEGQRVFGRAAGGLLDTEDRSAEIVRVAGRLRAAEADFAMRRGLQPEVARLAEEVLELARQAGDTLCEARGLYYRGKAQWDKGDTEAAKRSLQRSLELSRRELGDDQDGSWTAATTLQRWNLNLLGGLYWSQEDLDGAEAYVLQMRDLAVRTGDRADEAVAYGNLGLIFEDRGDCAQALAHLLLAVEISDQIGRTVGPGIHNLAELYLQIGDYEAADQKLDLALTLSREHGARKTEALTLTDMGLLESFRDRFDGAAELGRQALSIAEEIDDISAQAGAWLCMGSALLATGDLPEAREAFEASLDRRRKLDQVNQSMPPIGGLARVAMRSGDLNRAVGLAETMLCHLDECGSLAGVFYPSDVYMACYEVLAAAEHPRATGVLEAAHRDMLDRAGKISDEVMRRSFLENVPAHRTITAAWSAADRGSGGSAP